MANTTLTFSAERAAPGQATRLVRLVLRPQGIAGLAVVGIILVAGAFAPLLAPYSPLQQGPSALGGSSLSHLLGTDQFGRDIFSRMLYGIRVDLFVGFVGVPIGAIIGTTLGLLTRSVKPVDVVIQRLFDILLAFPALILGLAIAALLSPGEFAIVLTIVVSNIPIFGRLARGAVLQQSEREYIVAARTLGAKGRRVLVRHVLPNSLDALVVQTALSLSQAVLLEGGMSFVGIGIQPPQPSLGSLLNESVLYLSTLPAFALGPMIALAGLVLGFNLIADALNAVRHHTFGQI